MRTVVSAILLCSSSIIGYSQCYSVTQIAYIQDSAGSGQQLSANLGDDQWSSAIPIGFTFCFYGEQYDSLLIGTNGILTFETDSANLYCQWPIAATSIPAAVHPKNSIMLPWADVSFNQGIRIYWSTAGIAPNRTFTVTYDSMPMYQCNQVHYSSRAVLHEGSNEIEIQLDVKPYCSWNGNRAIIGLQNQLATSGVTSPGRTTPIGWNAAQEGWLFTPTCDVCNGVTIIESAGINDFFIYPNPSGGAFTLHIESNQSEISSYDVMDMCGRVILSQQLNGAQQTQFTLENPGMYFVRVYDQAGTLLHSEKIAVE